jgi:hypothetical protein
MGIIFVVGYELGTSLNWDDVTQIVLLLDSHVVCKQTMTLYESFQSITPQRNFLCTLN